MVNLAELDIQAPPGAFSTLDMEVFVPEVQKLKAGDLYLEIGVDKGKSLWIAKQVVADDIEIHGIDLKKDPEIEGTYFHRGNSYEIAESWQPKINLLFVDGDHSYWGCRKDISSWYPHMAENSVMLFHDCDESSPGVVQAIAEFADTHRGLVKNWQLFKRTDKNTSMSKIQL